MSDPDKTSAEDQELLDELGGMLDRHEGTDKTGGGK